MKYLKLFENFNNDIEIIILKDNDILLLEGKFLKYKKDDKELLPISQEYRTKFNKIEKKLKNYINTLNPIIGINIHKNQIRRITYKFIPTEHFITKFERIRFEDPLEIRGFIEPDLYDGINLIYNNIDKITQNIASGTIKSNDKVLIKTIDNSKYSAIISIQYIKKNNYIISFITQMKGKIELKKRDDTDSILKLHKNNKSIYPKNTKTLTYSEGFLKDRSEF